MTNPEGFQPPPSKKEMKAQAAAAKAYNKSQKSWFARHKILTGLGALIALIVGFSAVGGGGSDTTPTATDDAAISSSAPAATKAPAVAVAKAPAKPKETSGQRNAKRAAKNYLSTMPFSRSGLIEQLSSDAGSGYSVADATYGVDAQNVDYKEQAYKAAKNYLSTMPFSRQGLIEQLSSDAGSKFTLEEATYGADKALAE